MYPLLPLPKLNIISSPTPNAQEQSEISGHAADVNQLSTLPAAGRAHLLHRQLSGQNISSSMEKLVTLWYCWGFVSPSKIFALVSRRGGHRKMSSYLKFHVDFSAQCDITPKSTYSNLGMAEQPPSIPNVGAKLLHAQYNHIDHNSTCQTAPTLIYFNMSLMTAFSTNVSYCSLKTPQKFTLTESHIVCAN